MRKIYRIHVKKHLPKFLRKGISNIFKKRSFVGENLSNWHKVWRYPLFPFPWANEYKPENFFSEKDSASGLFFAKSQGLKIYYAKNHEDKEACQESAAAAGMEQDLLSPHRYVTKENKMWGALERAENEMPKEDSFFVEKGDIVADIGASHGNFSISVIENAKHIYLFEANEIWNEPLQKTFQKYRDKITIVNKYVSDINNEHSVTLDAFFGDKEVNFIKADVEGYELQLLNGAKNILSTRSNIKCSICTYHKPQDARDFEKFFNELGYETCFTEGYMFCPINNTPQNTSFLRKCVIRARKEGKL